MSEIITIHNIRTCISDLSKGLKDENKRLQKVFKKNTASLTLSCHFKTDSVPSSYSVDKFILEKLFSNTEDTFDGIYTRLLVLDSTYSTQMTRRYYGLGELAEAIYILSSSKESFRDTLIKFAKYCGNKKYDTDQLFSYDKKECVLFIDSRNGFKEYPDSITNLFKEGFGTGKDKESKGVAISLITKYAFFLTNKQFPIYDSVVRETLPIVWKSLGQKRLSPISNSTQDITKYIKGINDFRGLFNNEFNYDEIDMFLWHLGKAMRGNFSLVLSMNEYLSLDIQMELNNEDIANIIKQLKKDGFKGSTLKNELKKLKEIKLKQIRIESLKKIITILSNNPHKHHLVSTFKLALKLLN